jgi:integrase
MEPNKRKLSELFLRSLKPQAKKFLVWDTQQRGLALLVQPSNHRSWKVIYSRRGRPRWYHIGAADAIGLANARRLAADVMYKVAQGKDPAAERKAERSKGSFEELAKKYVEEFAKKKNRSWKQADDHIRRHVIPRLGKMLVTDITRADVRSMMSRIAAPISANQALAYTSAIFTWAIKQDLIKTNPCTHVERNPTTDRERVLSPTEIPLFWKAFDDAGYVQSLALKMILLTGQRPGEIRRMRSEHIVDGWWQLPGAPDPKLGWPGTKNKASHAVWLPKPALAIIEELDRKGMLFASARGGPIQIDKSMQAISKALGVPPVTPHDLRRTHGTRITALGYGRDAMNRIQNHKEGGIASVYDRHAYKKENQTIMEAVAANIMEIVDGGGSANVIQMRKIKI